MEISFPEPDDVVQATLARVLDLKGMAAEAQLVRMAVGSIQHSDHDNWNGGIDYYTLRLLIPLEVFVQIEPEIDAHEKRLAEVAGTIWRDFEADIISTVRLLPDRAAAAGTEPAAAIGQLPTFWDVGGFRLFISHCSSRRVEVGQLKVELAQLGVSAFVAHDDIEPSLLWQAEIEKALRTCEALAAVISDDFITSRWCDQEVGHVIGRGLPVLPIQFGASPHGFIAKVQALGVPKDLALASIAPRVVGLLLKSAVTSMSMTAALVRAVCNAHSYAQAKAAAGLLESAPVLQASHAKLLREALHTNSQVAEAFGVPDRIHRILKSHKL